LRRRRVHRRHIHRSAVTADVERIDRAAAGREMAHQRIAGKRQIKNRSAVARAMHQQHRRQPLAHRRHLPKSQGGQAVTRDVQQTLFHDAS
jgi:hypothetical protein